MCTQQKYEGRGNNALNSSLAVNSDPQTANLDPLTAAQRELAGHQKDADEGHLELFRTVEYYCGFPAESNPVAAINDILQEWLALPTTNLPGNEYHRHRLHALLETVNFITACRTHLNTISYYEGEIDQLQKEAGNVTSPLPTVAPPAPVRFISLDVHTAPDTAERPTELHVLREALLFYKERLLQLGESNPASLLSADTANDILENLTAEAFTALGERSAGKGKGVCGE